MSRWLWSCRLGKSLAVPEPKITTAAGTGRAGDSGDGGRAVDARLKMPFDVAFDAGGNLYLSDTFNHRVRRIDRATGTIKTVAGNGKAGYAGDGGPAVQAQLNEPYGVVLDPRRKSLRRRSAQPPRPSYRCADGRDLLGGRQRQDGVYSGDGGPATSAGLVEPNGVAMTLDGRDPAHCRRRWPPHPPPRSGQWPDHDLRRDRTPPARWRRRTSSIALPSGVLVPSTSDRMARFTSWSAKGTGCASSAPSRAISQTIAGTGSKGYSGDGGPALSARFDGPKELDVDSSGNIWIVDTENHAIRFIDAATRQIRTVAGNGQAGQGGDGGLPAKAQLDRPHGVAVGTRRLVAGSPIRTITACVWLLPAAEIIPTSTSGRHSG